MAKKPLCIGHLAAAHLRGRSTGSLRALEEVFWPLSRWEVVARAEWVCRRCRQAVPTTADWRYYYCWEGRHPAASLRDGFQHTNGHKAAYPLGDRTQKDIHQLNPYDELVGDDWVTQESAGCLILHG